MNSYQEKAAKKTQKSVANEVMQQQATSAVFQFEDNRPETAVQLKIKEKLAATNSATPIQQKKNNTGLPNKLKSGIENLSGHSMDDVKVYYNSSKPAQLNAHAYAQGTNIHIASGQEKHLPHEAWHVVQQKQGRVKPTKQLKQKVNINDDVGLEKEADIMGAKAMQMKAKTTTYAKKATASSSKETLQLFSYRGKAPIKGVTMSVKIVNGGGRLTIIDETETDKAVGHLGGYIKYSIDKANQELVLDHFEAHPSGAGLGTLLMFELANLATRHGFKIISVANPALSAMGAYKAFGGVPRDAQEHEARTEMYAGAMQENPRVHRNFVKNEAHAIADSVVGKEKYFNPGLKPLAEANTYIGAVGDHKAAHSGADDIHRAADLSALSSQLIYHVNTLNRTTFTSLDRRWDITG
ncbi:DUF4157 domain-containing protein [Kordia algicida OT-1]|uniref:eCIS core domain-containing protein n=1 Tax=Kordia algicida OT-1 TaxID=391587 RepID=A9DMM5_9FLAO|nr:DUF4157 domain-containing protein [Kordia algicida]EDP97743.1 hypothetical protein KAOT1_21312 [Kordia algicida OT-1]